MTPPEPPYHHHHLNLHTTTTTWTSVPQPPPEPLNHHHLNLHTTTQLSMTPSIPPYHQLELQATILTFLLTTIPLHCRSNEHITNLISMSPSWLHYITTSKFGGLYFQTYFHTAIRIIRLSTRRQVHHPKFSLPYCTSTHQSRSSSYPPATCHPPDPHINKLIFVSPSRPSCPQPTLYYHWDLHDTILTN